MLRDDRAAKIATGILGMTLFGSGALMLVDPDLGAQAMVLGLAIFSAAVAWSAIDVR